MHPLLCFLSPGGMAADSATGSLIATTSYRLATIAAGVALCWMGYQLFKIGIYEKGGDLNAAWGSKKIVLKQAGPGTFFALFGCVVLGLAIYKGMNVQIQSAVPPVIVVQKETDDKNTVSIPDVNSLLMAPPNTAGMQPIFAKVSTGQALDENERKVFSDWLTKQQQFNNSIHIEVLQPPRTDVPSNSGTG